MLTGNVASIRLRCWRFKSETVRSYDVLGIAAVFFSILRGDNIAARLFVFLLDCCRLQQLVNVNRDTNILIWIEMSIVPNSVMFVVVLRVCLFVMLIFFVN